MIVATPTLVPSIVPIEKALARVRQRRGTEATRGLAPGLLVPAGTAGWTPATALVTGRDELDHLLDAAKQRWGAPPHVAAALAWRSYTYWLAMPVVLGWATSRRVPVLDPDDVLVQFDAGGRQLLTIGLRRLRLAVLPDDPVAGTVGTITVDSEAALRDVLRSSLRVDHLDPLLAQLQARANLGTRTLLGSLASAVAYGVVRGLDAPPAGQRAAADTLLRTLDVADLVALEPGPDGQLTVERRTCCLAFTLPEPKVCSGCCLARR